MVSIRSWGVSETSGALFVLLILLIAFSRVPGLESHDDHDYFRWFETRVARPSNKDAVLHEVLY